MLVAPELGPHNPGTNTPASCPVVLEISDSVRIRHLAIPQREVDGASATPPQPRVGEIGTVVDALGEGLYLVERATDDGESLWLAEFHESELDLVDRAEH